MVLHARVKGGRYIIDEPADLAEGSVVELVPIDDTMVAEERAKLLVALDEAEEDLEHGRHVDGVELIAALKARREAPRR